MSGDDPNDLEQREEDPSHLQSNSCWGNKVSGELTQSVTGSSGDRTRPCTVQNRRDGVSGHSRRRLSHLQVERDEQITKVHKLETNGTRLGLKKVVLGPAEI